MPAEPQSSRDKILDVAEALFAQRGFAGVGMQEVAQRVGLGKSSLFHHFATKLDLYVEVIVRVIARFGDRLAPVLDGQADPGAQLDRVVDTLIDALAEHPTTARLLLRTLVEDDQFPDGSPTEVDAIDSAIAALLDRVGAVVQAGIDSGAFRPVSIPHMLQSLIGLTIYHFASGDFGEGVIGAKLLSASAVRERKREVRQFLHHGLGRAPA